MKQEQKAGLEYKIGRDGKVVLKIKIEGKMPRKKLLLSDSIHSLEILF